MRSDGPTTVSGQLDNANNRHTETAAIRGKRNTTSETIIISIENNLSYLSILLKIRINNRKFEYDMTPTCNFTITNYTN